MRLTNLKDAMRAGVKIARKSKAALTRFAAYRIVHFGLRKTGRFNEPMPPCVRDDLNIRFPDGLCGFILFSHSYPEYFHYLSMIY
jgi:hypothetical protein